MNAKAAQIFLAGRRENSRWPVDPRVEKAIKIVESKPELAPIAARWQQFDRALLSALEPVTAPESLQTAIATLQALPPQKGDWKRYIFQPAILGVIFGVLLICGFGVYFWMNRADNFPGLDAAQEMLSVAQNGDNSGLEPVNKSAGEMGDWLFLKYGVENFFIPTDFAKFTAVGCRLLKQDGHPVALIAAEPGDVLFYVFRAEDFGMTAKSPDQWHVFVQEDWVAALRVDGDNGFIVAKQGDEDTMAAFLAKLPSNLAK
ncbi:MAG: hypothetical protein QM796_15845 [Chthoniobacteraceae bacterium]